MNLKTEEIKVIAELPYSWEKIKDKTILVSGGTGFIGTAFLYARHAKGTGDRQTASLFPLNAYTKTLQMKQANFS